MACFLVISQFQVQRCVTGRPRTESFLVDASLQLLLKQKVLLIYICPAAAVYEQLISTHVLPNSYFLGNADVINPPATAPCWTSG